MPQINQPSVIAELTELHLQYETALYGNDVEMLTHLFWDSPLVIRFGLTENLYGQEQISQFRQSQASTLQPQREVFNFKIVAFDAHTAILTLEFREWRDGTSLQGRRSQTWYKFPEGWKIVSAHVSYLDVQPSGIAY
ncbi:MAG: AtzH-like domain-containing protein [Leptolyngbyaceae bacterium]|nr:AtzH-like domain-containing protein [Leptolyngbyaceae bacterium]